MGRGRRRLSPDAVLNVISCDTRRHPFMLSSNSSNVTIKTQRFYEHVLTSCVTYKLMFPCAHIFMLGQNRVSSQRFPSCISNPSSGPDRQPNQIVATASNIGLLGTVDSASSKRYWITAQLARRTLLPRPVCNFC
ncbi:hypothetical protein EVAR_60336_1 [Eumeta japonica]|uniref:Uncharacterized protein n=1 Tax=Eumeta variegata TaxID=151549 RepID=A0A4C1ZAJ2_EUMVA|nr:hypothetical protein EVAR_60336_1 [Eumeta japonica]